jgi:hypothetical protein
MVFFVVHVRQGNTTMQQIKLPVNHVPAEHIKMKKVRTHAKIAQLVLGALLQQTPVYRNVLTVITENTTSKQAKRMKVHVKHV